MTGSVQFQAGNFGGTGKARVLYYETIADARAVPNLFAIAAAVKIKDHGLFYADPTSVLADDGINAFQVTGVNPGRFIFSPDSIWVNGVPSTGIEFDGLIVLPGVNGGAANVRPLFSRAPSPVELEDYFGSRLDAQWRFDRNSITLAGSGVSSVVERVTTRPARALVQATDSKRPSYHASIAALGGRPAIGDANVGAGHTKVLTCADASISLANPYARIVVFAPRINLTGYDVRLIGSADANRYCEIDVNAGYYAYEGAGSTASLIPGVDITSLLGHLIVINPQDNATEASNAWVYRSDGKIFQVSGIGSVTGRGSGDLSVLSWNVTSGFGFPGYIADVSQMTGTIKSLDKMAILQYANEWYGYTLPTREILFDGDSLMVGANPTLISVANALANNSAWWNCAVSGRTTPQVAEALPYASAKYSSLVYGIRRCYAVFEITNDISQYSDPTPAVVAANTATVIANVQNLINEARSLGFADVIVGTCLPRGSFTVGNGQETIRQNVNNYLVANWQAMGITRLVNLHTATAVDGQSCPAGLLDPTNPSFWNADQTHLVTAGYVLFVNQYNTRLVQVGF